MMHILKGSMSPNEFTIKDINYSYKVGRDTYVVKGKLGFYQYYFLINPTTLGMQGKEFIDVNGNIITTGDYGIKVSYSVAFDMKQSSLFKDDDSITEIPHYYPNQSSNEGYEALLSNIGSGFLPDKQHLLSCELFTTNFSHDATNRIPNEPEGFYWSGHFEPEGYIHVPDGQGAFYGDNIIPTEVNSYPTHTGVWETNGSYVTTQFCFSDDGWLDPSKKYLLPKLNELNFTAAKGTSTQGQAGIFACSMFIPYDPTNPEPSPTLLKSSDRVGSVRNY